VHNNLSHGLTLEMNTTEEIIVSWIPRLTSSLSFLGSLSIIYMILSDHKKKLQKTNHRLMFSLSVFDCLGSAAYAMTTLVFPSESNTYGALGNSSTCTIQGFFLILETTVPLYNASLSLFYLSTIRRSMHHTKFSTIVEPFLHMISILAPLTIAIIATSMGIIVPLESVCSLSLDDPIAQTLNRVLIGMVASCGLICFYSMASICHYVIRRSGRMRRYSFGTAQMRLRNIETRDTSTQALLYASAFIITYLFPAISLMRKSGRSFFLEAIIKILYPLQGFWNFLLYIRPRVAQVMEEDPGKNIMGVLVQVIFHVREIETRRRPNNRRMSVAREKREDVNEDNTSPCVKNICSQPDRGEVGYITSSDNNNSSKKSPLHLEEGESDCDQHQNFEHKIRIMNVTRGQREGINERNTSPCVEHIYSQSNTAELGYIASSDNIDIPLKSPLYQEKGKTDCDQHRNYEHVSTFPSSSSTRLVGMQHNDLGDAENLEKANIGDWVSTPIRSKGVDG